MADVFEGRISSGVLSGPTSKKYQDTADERNIKITPKNPFEDRLIPDNGFVVTVSQAPRNEGELIVWIDQSNDPQGIASMYCAVDDGSGLNWKVVELGSQGLTAALV